MSPPIRSDGEWDFYWCDVSWLRENFDHTYMDEHVRISHFRNHYEVSWVGPEDWVSRLMALRMAVNKSWFGVIRTRMKSVRHFGVCARWGLCAPLVTVALVTGSKDLRPEEQAALGWG